MTTFDATAKVNVKAGFTYETEKFAVEHTMLQLGELIEDARKRYGGVSVENDAYVGAVVFTFPGTSWTITAYNVDIVDTRKAWREYRHHVRCAA